jgi:hypothetical protein
MILDNIGGRKFLITVMAWVATNALAWWDRIDDVTYAAVTIATVAAYITGDVIHEIKKINAATATTE